jgi:uncharacterized membrane protein
MFTKEFTFKTFLTILIIIFALIAFASFIYIIFDKAYYNPSGSIDTELAYKFGGLFSGFVGTLFSVLSVLLIIYTINNQAISAKKENVTDRFFKMVDYHNANVFNLNVKHIDTTKTHDNEGRRAFVIFKIQLKRLMTAIQEINASKKLKLKDEEIIDIAYMIFYYGLDKTWIPFIDEKLKNYKKRKVIIDEMMIKINSAPTLKIGRTNQTSLSSYFRNMYNAIKLVDESKLLMTEEKLNLIKIYRAQLSNPELYILFYNIASRFGKKWKEKNYIVKYELLKNMPNEYGDLYDHKKIFPMNYEDDEY